MKELILSGRVQGVFCRHYCSQNARRLGLRGSATNLYDGTVRVVINSDNEDKIEQYVECLKNNPYRVRFWGKITDIQVAEHSGSMDGDYMF